MTTYTPHNAYRKTGISTANEGKLIVMLYDGTIKNLRIAIAELESEKPKLDLINNKLNKSQDLITELIVSLDFDKGGNVATNLFSLYQYFNTEIMQANISKTVGNIPAIIDMMLELKDAWSQIENVKKTTPSISLEG